MNLVERFAEVFNRGNVDGLLARFTGDATYGDLFHGPHTGQAALRGMFERMFREGRDYREYADTGVALLQLGFAPESLATVIARHLPTA